MINTYTREKAAFISLCLFAGFLILAADTPPADTPSPLERFTPEQRQQLEAGQVVFAYLVAPKEEKEEKGLGHGEVYVLVKKSADECYTAMTDFSRICEYYPRIIESTLIKQEGENLIWVHTLSDFGLFQFECVMHETLDPEHRRNDFALDPTYDHDINDSRGFWYWEEIDAETALLTYGLQRLDVGIPVPEFVLKGLASRDLPAIAANIKKWIESGGTWKKE